MGQVTRARRRAAAGIAAVLGGTVGLAIIGAGVASAHEGTEPDKPEGNPNCADLAELYEPDAQWEEDKIEPFPNENGEYEYTLSDRGTPDDESDDAVFTLEVFDTKRFNWSSTVGIDAIFVKGGQGAGGNYAYYFWDDVDGDGQREAGEEHVELTEDVDYTVPPWGDWDRNAISHITICWDDESTPPTTAPPTTAPPTTAPPTTAPPTTAPPTSDTTAPPSSETTATTAPSSTVTTEPSTTTTAGEELPETGSNSTMLLVSVGAALLAVGAALVFGTRYMWRRNAV